MHLDRAILHMYRRSGGLSTRPHGPNTLTCQSTGTNAAHRDLLRGPVTHIQQYFPYLSPNTIFIVTPLSHLSSHHNITNDHSANFISHNHPSPLSHLTTTNQVDTYGKNCYDIQFL